MLHCELDGGIEVMQDLINSRLLALVVVYLEVESAVGVVGMIAAVVAIMNGLVFDASYLLAW